MDWKYRYGLFNVGTVGFFNSFFATVCTRLEDGVWGSRFPNADSLYWAGVPKGWWAPALSELEVIKREVSALPASDVVWVVGLPEVKPSCDVGGDSEAVNLAEFFTTVDGKNLIDELMDLLAYAQQIDSHVLKNYVYDPYID